MQECPDLYCPSDDDIKKLLKHVAGTDLEIAILLAAFGPMRRGEICALESSDIKGSKVSVTKSMVMGPVSCTLSGFLTNIYLSGEGGPVIM